MSTRLSRLVPGRGFLLWSVVTGVLLPASLVAQEGVALYRAKWETAGVDDYEYRYEKVCECRIERPAEFFVTVRQGRVVGVRHWREDLQESTLIDSADLRWYRTIDDLFTLIEAAQSREILVRAAYDTELGYPTRVFVDYEPARVGEELDIRITAFRSGS